MRLGALTAAEVRELLGATKHQGHNIVFQLLTRGLVAPVGNLARGRPYKLTSLTHRLLEEEAQREAYEAAQRLAAARAFRTSAKQRRDKHERMPLRPKHDLFADTIDMSDPQAIIRWNGVFGTTRAELQRAVDKVGTSAAAVSAELNSWHY
jgi:hypothetical protein